MMEQMLEELRQSGNDAASSRLSELEKIIAELEEEVRKYKEKTEDMEAKMNLGQGNAAQDAYQQHLVLTLVPILNNTYWSCIFFEIKC